MMEGMFDEDRFGKQRVRENTVATKPVIQQIVPANGTWAVLKDTVEGSLGLPLLFWALIRQPAGNQDIVGFVLSGGAPYPANKIRGFEKYVDSNEA